MHLPGRLRMSTLGDLLGTLHRARISGVLALRELSGATAGRCHRVYLRAGLVVAVETVADQPSQDPEPMDRAQVRQRLEALYRLDDAELTFHVARGGSALANPLTPAEFLHGRPRARDRQRRPAPAPTPPPYNPAEPPGRRRALAALGLGPGATVAEIRRAFRAMALRLHPDRYPEADEPRRAELARAFARLTQAYQQLTAAPSAS